MIIGDIEIPEIAEILKKRLWQRGEPIIAQVEKKSEIAQPAK